MAYVVLGMHKSGTSLVSEILHHSGIDMGVDPAGAEGLGYDRGNKHEREETFALNNDILDSHGVESIDIEMPDAITADAGMRARMGALVDRLSRGHESWGFKDPRTCLTYPLWAPLLPDHRIVAVYRPLYQLTTRYRAERSFGRAYRVVRSWHEHNVRILSYLKNGPAPGILLSYDRLMDGDSEFGRLERFVGRPLADRRRRDLRRGTSVRGAWMRAAETAYRLRTGRSTRGTLEDLESATTTMEGCVGWPG